MEQTRHWRPRWFAEELAALVSLESLDPSESRSFPVSILRRKASHWLKQQSKQSYEKHRQSIEAWLWMLVTCCDFSGKQAFSATASSLAGPQSAVHRHRIHWEGKDHKQAQTAKTIYPRSTKWLADESELILCQNLFTPIVPHVITWNLDCGVSALLLLQHQWANMRKVGKGSQQNTSVTSQLPWTSVTAAISISPSSERASSSALTSFWQTCLFFGNEKASSKRTLRTDWERSNWTENCSGIVVGLWI